MKLIHTADLHLGSSFEKLPRHQRDHRNRQLVDTFVRLCDYAMDHDVHVVLLAGDVFDTSERQFARLRDRKAFYDVVAARPDLQFFYLRGNHDRLPDEEGMPDNLHTFSADEWTYYTEDDITISGIEQGTTDVPYEQLALDADRYNIVLLHGQAATDQRGVHDIPLPRLARKNIDYLALGHIHSYQQGTLDTRGQWAYPGCLMGRGYDEAGEKGFLLVDTDERTTSFVPFARHQVYVLEVDVSGTTGAIEAIDRVNAAVRRIPECEKHMLKVVLTGDIAFDAQDEQLTERVASHILGFFHHRVEDRTTRHYSFDEFRGQTSLAGEFVGLVLENDDIPDEEMKNRIMDLGLKVLLQ